MFPFTVNLTETEYKNLQHYVDDLPVSAEIWVKDLISQTLSSLEDTTDWASLSDDEVRQLARSMMPEEESDRMWELDHAETLTLEESAERDYLWRKYWIGQKRKALAMGEAKRRGFLQDILSV